MLGIIGGTLLQALVSNTLHAALSYNDAKRIFFPQNVFRTHNKLCFINKQIDKELSVFASIKDKHVSLFFHTNHTLFATLCDTDLRDAFHELKLWHANIYDEVLEEKFENIVDLEAWYASEYF